MQIYLKNGNEYVLQRMQSAGFNVMTCGMCGCVKLYEKASNLEELECEYCGFTSEHCDFPDLRVVEQADVMEVR